VRSGCGCCRTPSTTFRQPRTFEFSSLQRVKLWSTCVLFRLSSRLELTSWAYPVININSCLQALTKDISTLANIAPSALETIIFYCFIGGYISALTYYLLLILSFDMSSTETTEPIPGRPEKGAGSSFRLKAPRIRWAGARWRHLAKTIEWCARGGDAVSCQITLTTCYHHRYVKRPKIIITANKRLCYEKNDRR